MRKLADFNSFLHISAERRVFSLGGVFFEENFLATVGGNARLPARGSSAGARRVQNATVSAESGGNS